jgi:hypothetical protein
MTPCAFDDCGRLESIDTTPEALRRPCRSRALAYRVLVSSLTAALIVFAIRPLEASEIAPVKIAVFGFELRDTSAGGGIIAPDVIDKQSLRQSTEEARRILSTSGRYSIVDTSSVATDVNSAGGVQYCNGCDAPLAEKLGAEQSLVGVVTRVSRTDYTLQILIRDAQTGKALQFGFSGLRMGANYSWPRGVKSLMNRLLSERPAQ